MYPPYHHEPKWRIPVATITFKGYDPQSLELFTHFAVHVASALGIPTSKPYALPKQRRLWTVLKSPFIFKKAQENFERITHSRGVKAWDADIEIVNLWTAMLREHAMPGVGMRVVKWTRMEIGGGGQSLKDVEGEIRGVFRTENADRVKRLGEKIVETELANESTTEEWHAERPSEENKAEAKLVEENRTEVQPTNQPSETQLAETQPVEVQPVKVTVKEDKLVDAQSAEKPSEEQLAKAQLAEIQSAEKMAEEQPSLAQATKVKLADGNGMEEKIVEAWPVEVQSAEERTTEATGVPHVEDQPLENTQAEENIAEGQPVEVLPAKGMRTEESTEVILAELQQVEVKIAEMQPAEITLAKTVAEVNHADIKSADLNYAEVAEAQSAEGQLRNGKVTGGTGGTSADRGNPGSGPEPSENFIILGSN